MAISNLIADAKQRMNTSVETVRRELATMRTGRASLSMLDNVRVDYYGTPTPLNQVGNLSTPDPTLIQVQPWDAKLLGVIEKAIRSSDLDLNPQNDGEIIRDDEKKAMAEVQKMTDQHIEEINETLKKKETEIMAV